MPSLGLDRVAETVTEVEQGAFAAAVFDVFGDDPRLGPDRSSDSLLTKVAVAGQDSPAVRLAPGEESGIVDQAIFDDFSVARTELPWIERVEERRIGDDQRGLVKGADQILLAKGIDCGLAANRTVGLSQQGCRQVDDRTATLEQGRCQARKIADASATQRNDRRVAGHAALGKPGEELMKGSPVLGRLSLRDNYRVGAECVGHGRSVQGKHSWFADEDWCRAASEIANPVIAGLDGTDQHIISAMGQVDPDNGHSPRCSRIAAMMASTTSLCAPLLLRTWIWASE